MRLLRSEKSRPWVQVRVSKQLIRLLSVQASCGGCDVIHEIHRPAKKLLHHDAAESSEGSVFSHLIQGFELLRCNSKNSGVLFGLRWNIVVVFGKIVGVDVMPPVRRLPRKVRSHQRGVNHPAEGIV